MLSGHRESVFVSVMHEGSGMAVYCFAIDDWLSVCVDAIQQFHIPSDESLEQGRKPVTGAPILHGTAPISHPGLRGGTTAAALLIIIIICAAVALTRVLCSF